MSRINKILAVVLALQLVLFGVRAAWPDSSDEPLAPGGALVADFDPAAITQVTLANNAGMQITLKKVDDNWILPDYDDYPVESARITPLLDKIQQIRADRLITQSETSFRRLQVSPDDFVRLITFDQADGKSHKLYIGKTGGGTTAHVRLDDQNQVYLTSNLTSSDANVQASGWIDTVYFSATAENVFGITLQNANGTFEFTKDGDTWTVSGLGAGETLNQDNFNSLLNGITLLRMTQPISREVQDDFGMDAPQATITLKVMETEAPAETTPSDMPDMSELLPESTATLTPTPTPQMVEKEYTFQIGAELDEGVVIKASNADYYVLIAKAIANQFVTKTQADFTTVLPTPTPEPTLTPAPPTETPLPTEIPTEAPTEVPTETLAPTEAPTLTEIPPTEVPAASETPRP